LIDARIWLLDAAVELGVDLRTLAADNIREVLNRKPHGHPPEALALILAQMCADGEIILDGDLNWEARKRPFSDTEIIDLMQEWRTPHRRSWYRLTERGGAAWEAWAKPQWSRYNTSCSRENIGAIGAATACVAEELLRLEEYLEHQRVIVAGSIRRRSFHNWRATYWKTLPEGHLIAFRTRPQRRSEWSPMPHREWARWVDLRKFYLKPADCGF
jgi:hypothetical protein